jgi:signal transduction histidine kinase
MVGLTAFIHTIFSVASIIRDNGRGCLLQGEQSAACGRGISGMRDRTHRWGGDLRIRSGSKGTKVHATWSARR